MTFAPASQIPTFRNSACGTARYSKVGGVRLRGCLSGGTFPNYSEILVLVESLAPLIYILYGVCDQYDVREFSESYYGQ